MVFMCFPPEKGSKVRSKGGGMLLKSNGEQNTHLCSERGHGVFFGIAARPVLDGAEDSRRDVLVVHFHGGVGWVRQPTSQKLAGLNGNRGQLQPIQTDNSYQIVFSKSIGCLSHLPSFDDVTDGVNVGLARLLGVVDDDLAVPGGFDAGQVQAQRAGVGVTADGEDDSVEDVFVGGPVAVLALHTDLARLALKKSMENVHNLFMILNFNSLKVRLASKCHMS